MVSSVFASDYVGKGLPNNLRAVIVKISTAGLYLAYTRVSLDEADLEFFYL